MIGKIFYNVIVFGTIISVCIFPLLIFLSKNKYKYNFKSIYKVLALVLLVLFIPINTVNFSNIKNVFQRENMTDAVVVLEEPQIKFETEKIVIEVDENINVKNDTFFSISQVLPYVWLTITIGLLGYNMISYIVFLYKEKKNYINEKNPVIDCIMNKLCKQMNLKKVSYRISENISTPMTIGLFNKKIILSNEVLEENQYEIILKHELFHIKNKDIEYKFLLLVLNCIYWFNPIIYMFTNQVDEILELNCDEYVLKNQNQIYRVEYAKTLLSQIEKNRSKQYKFSMNFANRRKNIMRRFSNIVDKSKKRSVATIATVTAVLLIISVLLIVLIPNINFATIQESIIETVNNENKVEANVAEKITNEEISNDINSTNIVGTNTIQNTEVQDKKEKREEYILVNTKDTTLNTVQTDVNKESQVILQEAVNTENKESEAILQEATNIENKEISLSNPLKDSYSLTSRFGPNVEGTHTGIDLAAINGTNIYAADSGKVVFSGWKGSYGYLVIIDHGNNVQTYYSQCSKLLKNEGEEVKKGDVIAQVGSTGNSTGPHLHFEVRKDGDAVNPENYISF